MKRLLACALAGLAGAAAAQERRPHPWEARLEGALEELDREHEDWREAAAQLAWRPTNRMALLAGWRETERFGQRDREAAGGAYLPIPGAKSILHVEGTWSPTHRVLPRRVLLGEIAQPLEGGWVVTAGGKAARFALARADSAWVTLEKYVGDWRLAWQANVSRPEGAGWAPSHRLSATWYRGADELTFVTLTGARGRELENVPPAGLLQSEVRAAALSGGLGLTPQWGLTFEIGRTRQGDLYTRRGARLGTRILF